MPHKTQLKKINMRKHARAIRKNAHNLRGRIAGGKLANHINASGLIPQTPTIIAGYRPIGSEINTDPILRDLAAWGHKICLPVITNTQTRIMQFRHWQPAIADNAQGKITPLGFYAPNEGAEICIPQIVLVPLIACDRNGNRIGQGGGYYDATLAKLKARAIGLAFQEQISDQCPTEQHDIPLDALVTDKQCLFFNQTLRTKMAAQI